MSGTRQVAERDNPSLVQHNDNYQLNVEDIKRYICPEATDAEAYSFLRLCQAQNLNPFLREAYLIKYGNVGATIVVGKDVFLKRAETVSEYKGFTAGIVLKKGDDIIKREGNFFIPDEETLVGAWAEVHRTDRDKPIRIEVPFCEYVQTNKEGKPNKSWAKMPSTMIRKVALVQAFREAFPNEFGGLYDGAEMPVDYEKLNNEKITITEGELTEQEKKNISEEFEQPHPRPTKESAIEKAREKAYQDWTNRIPENESDLEEFLVRSCKRFYAFMKSEYGYDNKMSKQKAEEILGFQIGEISSMNDVLKNPDLRRDLNTSIWTEKEKVLFP